MPSDKTLVVPEDAGSAVVSTRDQSAAEAGVGVGVVFLTEDRRAVTVPLPIRPTDPAGETPP